MSAGSGANPPAVVLGGEVTALSVARSLHAAGVDVHVLSHARSPTRFSRSIASFIDVGHESPGEAMLDWLCTAGIEAVVLAASDEGVELIARHRAELVDHGHHPVEGDDEVLLAMLDKLRTYELAAAHGIAVPRVVRLRGEHGVEAALEQLTFPCVLKPVRSDVYTRRARSGGKVIVVRDASDLRRQVARLEDLGVEMFVTEVIYGDSDEFVSYYGYLDERGSSLLHLTKRKLRQYPPGFGTGTYHQTTLDPEVAAAGEQFMRAVGMRGLGNVEFKRSARDGQLVLIECNPRFTLVNELIQAAGIDLALFCYDRALGRPGPRLDGYEVGLHLWDPANDLRALRAYHRRGELSLREWSRTLAHRQQLPAFRAADPVPALARTRWMIDEHVIGPLRNRSDPAEGLDGGAAPPSTGARMRHQARSPAAVISALDKLASRAGARGRATATRLDLAYSLGPQSFRRQVRSHRRLTARALGLRAEVYERIWTAAAEQCNAAVLRLAPGLLELRRGKARTRVREEVVALDDPVAHRIALDKPLVHRMMSELGMTYPEHVSWSVTDPGPALFFLSGAGGPCVVKPAAGWGGHAVVPGIASSGDLLRARWHVGAVADRLLIERQAAGAVYRLLLLDGALIDVVRQSPPHLTGDGRSTLEQLIEAENERRVQSAGPAALTLIEPNLDMALMLRGAGLGLSSVLPAGQRIAVAAVTNRGGNADGETWRGEVHHSVIGDACRLASAIGLHLAGVDVLTTDISRPLADTGGVFSEINATPGLHRHYMVADPVNATPVAARVLERLLSGAG